MNKLLSICIPSYNRPKLLKRLLKSAIPQAKKYGVPIYISDDATNNLNKQIVDGFNYQCLFYAKNDRKTSRNVVNVIKMSNSKFCWVLGDDDIPLPGSISILLNTIKSKPNLQFISVNALFNNKNRSKYLKINKDLYFTNCVKFFCEFKRKISFGTFIINTRMFKNSDTDKYFKTLHLLQGGFLEYLAKYYNKNKQNNILVISTPMVLLGTEKKSWSSYFIRVKYYDEFLWSSLLPGVYKNCVENFQKNLLKRRSSIKELIQYRILNQLKPSEVDKWFYYFPTRTKIIAKFISKTPMFLARFIFKLNTCFLIFLIFFRKPKSKFLQFLNNPRNTIVLVKKILREGL